MQRTEPQLPDLVTDQLPTPREEPVAGKGTRVKGGAAATKQWLAARAAEALAKQRATQEQTILQQVLPLWSDEYRGVPNPMIRSGLFGTKSTTGRTFVRDKQIAALSNYSISYKGEELLQEDLSVFMGLLHIASRQAFGDTVFFTGYEIVKDLGWRMHSESYEKVKECISRLKSNEIKIALRGERAGYAGSLIREYAWDATTPDGDTKWMVRFEPMLTALFKDDSVTFLAWEQRKDIGPRASLALWLHAYYTSHRDPLPISVQKVHELTGSEAKEIRFYRRKVREALERLVEIGFLEKYSIENDIIRVVKRAVPRALQSKTANTQRQLT